jgi:hypothetical protein
MCCSVEIFRSFETGIKYVDEGTHAYFVCLAQIDICLFYRMIVTAIFKDPVSVSMDVDLQGVRVISKCQKLSDVSEGPAVPIFRLENKPDL